MPSKAAVIAAVRAMVGAVNDGDVESALSAFAGDAVVVEDVAPFRWQGAGAPAAWLSAMAANAEQNLTSVSMTLGEASRIEIDTGRAYSVFHGRLSLSTPEGRLESEGLLTFTLRAGTRGWLIDTLVWSGATPQAASNVQAAETTS